MTVAELFKQLYGIINKLQLKEVHFRIILKVNKSYLLELLIADNIYKLGLNKEKNVPFIAISKIEDVEVKEIIKDINKQLATLYFPKKLKF